MHLHVLLRHLLLPLLHHLRSRHVSRQLLCNVVQTGLLQAVLNQVLLHAGLALWQMGLRCLYLLLKLLLLHLVLLLKLLLLELLLLLKLLLLLLLLQCLEVLLLLQCCLLLSWHTLHLSWNTRCRHLWWCGRTWLLLLPLLLHYVLLGVNLLLLLLQSLLGQLWRLQLLSSSHLALPLLGWVLLLQLILHQLRRVLLLGCLILHHLRWVELLRLILHQRLLLLLCGCCQLLLLLLLCGGCLLLLLLCGCGGGDLLLLLQALLPLLHLLLPCCQARRLRVC
jgi:hypothetical protein